MKRFLALTLALLLLPALPGGKAEEGRLALLSDTVLLANGPVQWMDQAERLPNGNFVFCYIADRDADPVFGMYALWVTLVSPERNVLWGQHWGDYSEDTLFASGDSWQFVIDEGSFTREWYWEPSWDRRSWAQWDWDGGLISGSREAETLSDGEKRLVTNLYPFRMEDYCFGTEESSPAVRNHGKLIYLPDGTEAECPMGHYFQVNETVYGVSGPDGEPLVLRRYDQACRETLALTLPLMENEYVQAILPGTEGPILIFQRQKAVSADAWQETRRAFALRDDVLVPLPWKQERLIDESLSPYQDPLLFTDGGVICHAYRWAGMQQADSRLVFIDGQGNETLLTDLKLNAQYVHADAGEITVLGLDPKDREIHLQTYLWQP